MSVPDPALHDWVPIYAPSGAVVVNPPAARVFHTANQLTTTSVQFPLAFNSERYDTNEIHDVAVSNTRLTCKTAGVYSIKGHAHFNTNATGIRQLNVRLNGSNIIGSATVNAQAAGGTQCNVDTSYLLAVGDYVELTAWQTSGGNLDVLALTAPNLFSPDFMMERATDLIPIPTGAAIVSYGTTLPASPVDGQEAILVDSITNPTFVWRFRWNVGSSSAYKWEFIGGAPWVGTVGSFTKVGTGWEALTATRLTIPRAGEYVVQATSTALTAAGAADSLYLAVFHTAPATNIAQTTDTHGPSWWISLATSAKSALNQGVTVGVCGYSVAAGATFYSPTWHVLPARVA